MQVVVSLLRHSFLRLLIPCLLVVYSSIAQAHDIPSRVTVYTFVKPEGKQLNVLLRVPMEALGEIVFPTRGPGYLVISEADFELQDAARVYITESISFFENGVELEDKTLERVRVSLPSNRSFSSYDEAFDNIMSPPLDDDVNLFWRQGMLDMYVTYPIESAESDFSVDPKLGTLSDQTTTVMRFLPAGGGERVFNYVGNPGEVILDPRWFQAVYRFVAMGFTHILEGLDHLLFLFCLVIPLRSIRGLIPVVSSFTVAHSITLIGSAFGLSPGTLWFPPLIETLIALSIVYMAFENIVGAKLSHRWMVTFGFGLVHGFGFAFLFSDTLQFAGGHLFSSLLAFNVGVELGQLTILLLVIPLLNLLFRYVVAERVGTILLSALIAHTAWHWMMDRGSLLSQYQFQMPVLDAQFFAGLMRWGMLAIIAAAAVWGMYELFRRFGAVAPVLRSARAGEKLESR
ncbi:MAG: HupE/UreJ family protein [Gammaproteobacteria bacterium]|nr:HupE/UreJ family protein [Pseudomonadales bacterium]MCP5346970.1 HupE/UreJ family protein [Pseudomonadales bacterium]